MRRATRAARQDGRPAGARARRRRPARPVSHGRTAEADASAWFSMTGRRRREVDRPRSPARVADHQLPAAPGRRASSASSSAGSRYSPIVRAGRRCSGTGRSGVSSRSEARAARSNSTAAQQQRAAVLVERQTAPDAIEQLHAQRALEFGQRRAGGGLRACHAVGGSARGAGSARGEATKTSWRRLRRRRGASAWSACADRFSDIVTSICPFLLVHADAYDQPRPRVCT